MSDLSIRKYFAFARMKVVDQTVHGDIGGALIKLGPDERCRPICHKCGSVGTVHTSGLNRAVRDLNLADMYVVAQFEYRKVWCSQCGKAKIEELSLCTTGARVTYRLANYVHELCKHMPVAVVARHLDLNHKTVKSIHRAKLMEEFGETDYSDLRILAVDEIATKKGHHYMTVVLDYETGRVVWMGKRRRAETLDAFFADMTQEQKDGIEAVAMDMWDPYIKSVKENCPKADIVFDLFHVVQAFGKVIDKVRRAEYNRASEEDKKVIKGTRYLLLKNKENLKCDDKRNEPEHLKELLELNETLNSVYILKDALKQIYRQPTRQQTKLVLDQWSQTAQHIDHRCVRTFAKRLQRYQYGILNYCDHRISTGRLEGANNTIKVIKRAAYGYHDEKYFALKVKQALPGKRAG